MKIAILGAGNGGCAVAADLSLRGHEITLIKTSRSMHDDNFNYLQKNNGRISLYENDEVVTTNIKTVTRDLKEIQKAEIIIIYIQTNYHEELITRIVPYLLKNQIVLINPGYLSTAYMLKHCHEDIVVVEAQSSFIDCRIFEPGKIKIGFRNARNPLGVYPSKMIGYAQEKLDKLGFPFTYLDNVVEAALHNPNLIVHTVGAIMSIPRIEKTEGEYCMYHEVFTPSVWNILEALDKEKMDILQKLGFERVPYVEACKYRNSLDDSLDAKEVFFWYAGMPTRAKGPVSADSRYITEDVPQGLVMLETLGRELEIATPITTALIELASSALKRDMRLNGRTIARLGEENIKKILKDCSSKV
ncbi:MAG: NAD/NADP octopine/nopaline dehydrogenase family protein [Bacilli bacterium]|nr:NAD/NADP octopine/nopaline dehydrogenase family protein [Bacilli bacterium]